ncbi:MAG: hypothetical protein ABFR89_02440 [Actinomycetota bacterium]
MDKFIVVSIEPLQGPPLRYAVYSPKDDPLRSSTHAKRLINHGWFVGWQILRTDDEHDPETFIDTGGPVTQIPLHAIKSLAIIGGYEGEVR